MNAIDKIKKLHASTSIQKKDISLEKYMIKHGDENQEAVIKIKMLTSAYVPKYHSEDNQGYATMIYTTDGLKIGAFSNALHEFATFFYENVGIDYAARNKRFELLEDGFLEVKVSVVELDAKKSTYNFELLDGEIEASKIEFSGMIAGAQPLLLSSGK